MTASYKKQCKGPYSKGVSLIELMIASTLSILVIVTVLKVYVNSQHSSRSQSLNRQIQENGRFALQLIGEDIQMAKYYGLNIMPTTIDSSTTDGLSNTYGCGTAGWAANFSQPIFVSNNTNPYSSSCISTFSYTTATDILVVRHTDSEPVLTSAIKENHLYLYTSLTDGASFRADEDGVINDAVSIAVTETPAETYKLSTNVYYIRPCSVLDPDDSSKCSDDGIPTLVRQSLTADNTLVEPLVEYVESMQILLGIDTDSTPDYAVDRYVSADNVTDWEKVISARIYLLARSPGKVTGYDKTRKYILDDPDNPITKNDGIYRKVFAGTVFLRNPSLDSSAI